MVRNAEGTPMRNIDLTVFENGRKVSLGSKVRTDNEGRFELFLSRNRELTVMASEAGALVSYAGFAEVTTDQFRRRNQLDTIETSISVSSLKMGDAFAEFLYDGDPILLQAGKYPEMKKVLLLLEAFPDFQVRIVAHTDSKQGPRTSWRKGKQAADFTADYFYVNGIARDRIQTESKGSSQPVIRCAGRDCSAADHQANRRIQVYRVKNF